MAKSMSVAVKIAPIRKTRNNEPVRSKPQNEAIAHHSRSAANPMATARSGTGNRRSARQTTAHAATATTRSHGTTAFWDRRLSGGSTRQKARKMIDSLFCAGATCINEYRAAWGGPS